MSGQPNRFYVPLLGHGRHSSPRRGGCLMEFVAASVGESWTDRPLCTPPLLAHVARIVNDHTSAARRPGLAPLIPYLATGHPQPRDLQHDRGVCDALLHIAGMPPGGAAPDNDRFWLTRRRRVRQTATAAIQLIEATAAAGRRDDVLRDLLVTAINADRFIAGWPPLPECDWSPPAGAGGVTVIQRVVKPVGADWSEFRYCVDPDTWPQWLSSIWAAEPGRVEPAPAVSAKA